MNTPLMTKQYLGNSVYVDVCGSQLLLTTGDGVHTTNMIYLEAETYQALVKYVERHLKRTGTVTP